MNRIGYGIDVSHFQVPSALPWDSWKGKIDFVIVRAAYGKTPDRTAVEHIKHARELGVKIGLYSFFRISESVDEQLAALRGVGDAVGLGEGDIVPALDVEHDPFPKPGADVSPTWSAPAQRFVEGIAERWGNALVYITQREWTMLGRPAWVLHWPLWVAHYTPAAEPATPAGLPATIWQHRVGPFDPDGPGGFFGGAFQAQQIDQNRLLRPLPLVGSRITEEDRARVAEQVAQFLAEESMRIGEPSQVEEEKNA